MTTTYTTATIQHEKKEEEKEMEYTITKNPDYNSLEITFTEKPTEEVRAALKALKYRWHSVKHVWYGYTTEEEARAAIEGKKAESKPECKEEPKANKFGVKVGDLFKASWGYEQTNVDFFQVIKLIGESSARVRQVYPQMIKEEANGPMQADRTYKITSELLPPASYSVFIKDQEHGDIKRIKCWDKENKCPCFRLDSFATAFKVEGETTKCYESWYA